MPYNGPPPTSSGKDKVEKLTYNGPPPTSSDKDKVNKTLSYNGPPPTSSGKDKVEKHCLTMGNHRSVVKRIRSKNSVLQWATTDQ